MKKFKKTLMGAGFTAALVLLGAGCLGGDTLTLTDTTVSAGESITVEFTASDDYPNNAWIGIIPSDIAHGDEAVNDQHDVDYKYLSGKTSGSMTFTAPEEPGEWDFRMHDTDSGGIETASVSFTVE